MDSPRVRPGLRVAVVGAGFGGLTLAIRLAAAGARVVLFEGRDKPGGRAYVFEDQGFTFDAGPTVITAPQCLEEVFAAAGKKMADYVDLIPVSPFYRLAWHDGSYFDYSNDSEALEKQIAARNPDDVAGYHAFLEFSKRVFTTGYEELAAVPFLRFGDMLRCAPDLIRLRADRSVYRTVARFIKDEHLREAFSFHSLLVGGNPFETSAIYTLIHYLERNWGVFFARGGTGALVNAFVKLFGELGGELRLSAPVEKIELDDRRHLVSSPGRSREPFDAVVSNADLHHTYGTLLRDEVRAAPMARKLERMDWSMSLFVMYFGTDRTYDDVRHHTVIFGPRYEGLCRDIFRGHTLPEDFSLYLHAPSVTDRSLAPPGCASFYVLSPVPHLGNADLDWDQLAGEYGDRILAALEQWLPEVRKHIVVRRHFTPLDFKRKLGAYHGSAFSVAPTLLQSAWFRPHNRDPRIPGLYLVGAGTHPGAGLPGVVNSAKATAQVIIGDHPATEAAAPRPAPAVSTPVEERP